MSEASLIRLLTRLLTSYPGTIYVLGVVVDAE